MEYRFEMIFLSNAGRTLSRKVLRVLEEVGHLLYNGFIAGAAQRIRQQQKQRQDYKEVQRQLDQRRSQSFELTQLTTSPPPYNLDAKNEKYLNEPSAPTMTSPATLQLGKSRPHNAEMQESSWEIIRVNNLGAKLTRQKGTPALYFHGRTNKVYTLEPKYQSKDHQGISL